jgi:hypothetical protein
MTNEKDSDTPTSDAESQPPQEPPVTPPAPPQGEVGQNPDDRPDDQQNTARELAREFRWVEFAQLVVNGVLAVIGIIALYIYSGELEQMKVASNQTERAVILNMGQLAIANRNATTAENAQKSGDQSFKDEQRAWIGIASNGVNQFEANKPIIMDVLFVNSGKTPARNVGTRVETILNDARKPIPGPSAEQIRKLRKDPQRSGPAIAPEARFNFSIGKESPDDTEQMKVGKQWITANFENIKSKALILYDFGELYYDDISGRPHVTSFCIYLSDPDAKIVNFCPHFNDIQ